MNYTVRPISIFELPLLTRLYDYSNVDDMISENTYNIENGSIDIFALFSNKNLLGELHVKYESNDEREAVIGRRVYLFAFRVHKDCQTSGLGKYLLSKVIDVLTKQGYSEFTVGVEDDNTRAIHIYKNFDFTEIIARKSEEYQGDSYEYNLLLRRNTEIY